MKKVAKKYLLEVASAEPFLKKKTIVTFYTVTEDSTLSSKCFNRPLYISEKDLLNIVETNEQIALQLCQNEILKHKKLIQELYYRCDRSMHIFYIKLKNNSVKNRTIFTDISVDFDEELDLRINIMAEPYMSYRMERYMRII